VEGENVLSEGKPDNATVNKLKAIEMRGGIRETNLEKYFRKKKVIRNLNSEIENYLSDQRADTGCPDLDYVCSNFRKFRSRSFPAIVRIDSG
jgi:hypothetical protein